MPPAKRYLLAPGPTPVPPEVLAALAEPVLHHRGPDFRALMRRCLGRLQEVLRTQADVLVFTASGSGAFESAVVNLLSPGERVLAVSAGEFGERWARMARTYGAEVDELRYAWGETPQPEDVRARLAETGAEVVLLVHSETSTGVVADIRRLVEAAHEAGALAVVDAVSSLGAVPLETDAWQLDVVVSGSQKALMTPPGLSFVSVSPGAWERAARTTTPRFYLDWARMRAELATGTTPFTPAVSLVSALDVALGLLLAEGLDAAFARHAALGRACREGAKAMGLELFSPDEERSAVVTAILTPEGIDARELVLALRDRFGITVAGGHGELGARMFRIGHIGYYDVFDITTALAAVELLLAERGAEIERGAAVAAALEAYRAAVRA
ncbi:MAG TPA: alanine--glyoxylate aminotransferase family protein [Gaiellaceae bacterium]|jgi:aspartate aminotransferase-like enzyme|nr:alanine--glyoxylate aminotransferase family protein [Gaiellaceae bacterium]